MLYRTYFRHIQRMPAAMASCITLTLNPAVDRNSRVDRVEPEKKLRCEKPTYEPGGGGINVSRALRKLGAASRAVYLAGGPPGDLLAQLLEKEEIDHARFEIGDWTRENLIVFETSSTRQFRFGMPGAEVTGEEWDRLLTRIRELDPFPEYVVASGSIPPGLDSDAYAEIARITSERGGRLIADTSGPALQALTEAPVFLLKPNLAEFAQLSGTEIDHEADLRAQMKEVLDERDVAALLVSLGAGGAVLGTRKGIRKIPAPTVPIQSKVGAGDSMVAGLVRGLLRDWSIEEAARFGVAAGAAAVMTPGTELCRGEDAEELYRQMR